MITFDDGPAIRVMLTLWRAPEYLRVVRLSDAGKFTWDALDQLDDSPRPREVLLAYRRLGYGRLHLKMAKPHRSGWRIRATYAFVEPQPDDATMRDVKLWRAWCYEQKARDSNV